MSGKEIRFIDLFAGVGGFHRGLTEANQTVGQEYLSGTSLIRSIRNIPNTSDGGNRWEPDSKNSGFRCVWANEWDKYAAKVYATRFPETPLSTDDIREVPADSVPNHDLLCAGFPCQSFSVAGKRRGLEEARGTLFYEIARIAERKRPRLLLLENVKGILSHDKGRTFGVILEVLGGIGYRLEWQVLNSKWFGVPQNRERVFIVGHLGEEPRSTVFPIEETDGFSAEELGGGQRVSSCLDSNYYKGARRQRTFVVADRSRNYADQGRNLESPKPYTNNLTGVAKDNLVVIERPHGKNLGGEKEPCLRVRGEHSQVLKVPSIANTVCDGWLMDTQHHSAPMNQYRIHRLTPVECERLQGFPDGWTEGLSDTQRYKCMGNAVTVNVVKFLGERIRQFVVNDR